MDFADASNWHGPLLEFFIRWCLPALALCIGAALTWVLWRVGQLLHAHEKQSVFMRTGAIALDSMVSIVADLNATMKPKILAASEDGKLTAAEAKSLKDAAIATLKSSASAELKKDLTRVVGADADSWLGSLVEKGVALMGPSAAVVVKPSTSAEDTPTGEFAISKGADGSVTVTRNPPTPR